MTTALHTGQPGPGSQPAGLPGLPLAQGVLFDTRPPRRQSPAEELAPAYRPSRQQAEASREERRARFRDHLNVCDPCYEAPRTGPAWSAGMCADGQALVWNAHRITGGLRSGWYPDRSQAPAAPAPADAGAQGHLFEIGGAA